MQILGYLFRVLDSFFWTKLQILKLSPQNTYIFHFYTDHKWTYLSFKLQAHISASASYVQIFFNFFFGKLQIQFSGAERNLTSRCFLVGPLPCLPSWFQMYLDSKNSFYLPCLFIYQFYQMVPCCYIWLSGREIYVIAKKKLSIMG
jgi:hypothetical protein